MARLSNLLFRGSALADGPAEIAGVVSKSSVPGPYMVYLLDPLTLRVLRKTRGDASGNYTFSSIPLRTEAFLLVALDREGTGLNPGTSDFVSSELP